MYLSRIKLDTRKRDTQIGFVSPNRIHGNIEDTFNRDRRRRLWRIDNLSGNYYLLIVSEEKPDLKKLIEQFGDETEPGKSISYDSFLQNIKGESIWNFRLVANPTRSVSVNNNERGKVKAEVSDYYKMEWLKRKAKSNGFSLMDDSVSVVQTKWIIFKKKTNESVKFRSVTYEGVLKVENPELFVKALINGIGREKAYGMGMLTIAAIK